MQDHSDGNNKILFYTKMTGAVSVAGNTLKSGYPECFDITSPEFGLISLTPHKRLGLARRRRLLEELATAVSIWAYAKRILETLQ